MDERIARAMTADAARKTAETVGQLAESIPGLRDEMAAGFAAIHARLDAIAAQPARPKTAATAKPEPKTFPPYEDSEDGQ